MFLEEESDTDALQQPTIVVVAGVADPGRARDHITDLPRSATRGYSGADVFTPKPVTTV
jgi:hypothetical protein